MKWNLKVLVSALLLMSGASQTRANIYEWGIRGDGTGQSSTVCPGGSGVYAVPNADLTGRDLRMAYLIGADLYRANLSGANLYRANLNGANLAGAIVTGTQFQFADITRLQLYSTASYQARNLQGISWWDSSLNGWDLSGQNLTNAAFYWADLRNADLTGANLTHAYFYQGLLTNANLTGANLTHAYFYSSFQSVFLSNANLTGADLRGAQGVALGSATTANTVLTDGTIQGLHLDSTNPILSPTVSSLDGQAGTITISNTSGSTLSVNQTATTTFGGTFSEGYGILSLVKSGTGSLWLTGQNYYSGGTTLNGGTLAVTNANSLGSGSLSIGPATLEVAGSFADGRNINLTDPSATIQVDPSFTYSNSGTLSGNGGLSLTGSGTLILSGTNTYSGGTDVVGGTLIVTSNTALPDGTSLTVGAGATLIFDPSTAASPVTNSATASAVPEPPTFVLLSIGAIGMLGCAWRRRQKRSL